MAFSTFACFEATLNGQVMRFIKTTSPTVIINIKGQSPDPRDVCVCVSDDYVSLTILT